MFLLNQLNLIGVVSVIGDSVGLSIIPKIGIIGSFSSSLLSFCSDEIFFFSSIISCSDDVPLEFLSCSSKGILENLLYGLLLNPTKMAAKFNPLSSVRVDFPLKKLLIGLNLFIFT